MYSRVCSLPRGRPPDHTARVPRGGPAYGACDPNEGATTSRLGTAARLARHPRRLLQEIRRRLLALAGVDLPVGDRYRFGQKASRYDEIRSTSPTWDWEQRVAAKFLTGFPAGTSILDVPFGTGRFVPLYERHALRFTGVDRSPDMLSQARHKFPAPCARADLRVGPSQPLPFADDAFDVTLCFRFLPGIADQRDVRRTLQEIGRVTRGTAVLQFKHAADGSARPKRRLDRFARLGPRSPRALRRLLTDAGMFVTGVEEMPGSDRVIYFCRPMSPPPAKSTGAPVGHAVSARARQRARPRHASHRAGSLAGPGPPAPRSPQQSCLRAR